jgi:hypothetical protein
MSIDTNTPEIIDAPSHEELLTRAKVEAVKVKGLTNARVGDIVKGLGFGPVQPASPAVMNLTARHPYDAATGRIDVYKPGRWDTESDLVYMSPIISTGVRARGNGMAPSLTERSRRPPPDSSSWSSTSAATRSP